MNESIAGQDSSDEPELPSDVIGCLDSGRAQLRDALESVPVDLRHVRPSPSQWSVAEVLEHLVLVERGVSRMLRRLTAGGTPAGAARAVPSRLDAELVRDRSFQIETRNVVRPTGDMDWPQAWDALEESRRDLVSVLRSAGPEALAKVSAPHHLIGVLNGLDWLRFVGSHEERHAGQIRDVTKVL